MDYSFSDGNVLISEINPFLSTSQLDISLELPVTSSQLPVPDNTRDMNLPTGQIKLQKFSGYPTEDPERFLSDFCAYCTFNRINDDDPRKLAAFQLHLEGPAQVWFTCLEDDSKSSWEYTANAFKVKHMNTDNKPVLLVETEQFQSLTLLPNQQIEDYYSKIIEKGRKLSKNSQEVLLKFIQGLPSQLAFFVRAGNPEDVHAAMTSAKMGEAYGYRASTTSATPAIGSVAAESRTPDASKIHALELSVQDLTHKLDKLVTSSSGANFHQTSHMCNPRTNGQASDAVSRLCYNCQAPGHIQRRCNWAAGPPNPSSVCQLCDQFGHLARDCKLLKDNCKPSSGNGRHPRGTERGPLGKRN